MSGRESNRQFIPSHLWLGEIKPSQVCHVSLVCLRSDYDPNSAPEVAQSDPNSALSADSIFISVLVLPGATVVILWVYLKFVAQGFFQSEMDENMKQFQQSLIELEIEAEHLLLARHEMVENDKARNGNREALTALRKRARTTKTSISSPFASMMKDVGSRPMVKEVCVTCGNHDSGESTWMMFPGTDVFAKIPFHAAHTVLEADQAQLDLEAKKLQSSVKEKSYLISEQGALADKISPGVLRSLVSLTDKGKPKGV